jgi:hypothetical protein
LRVGLSLNVGVQRIGLEGRASGARRERGDLHQIEPVLQMDLHYAYQRAATLASTDSKRAFLRRGGGNGR